MQVITLTKTAQLCNVRPSDLAEIEDHEIAFAFNVECADILDRWELERETERETRQVQMMTGQAVSSALGGSSVTVDRSKADRW